MDTWCEHCNSWRGNPYCGREDCPTPAPESVSFTEMAASVDADTLKSALAELQRLRAGMDELVLENLNLRGELEELRSRD
jgi:hypothetical protein